MSIRIFSINIVKIIGNNQINSRLFMHAHKSLIDCSLLQYTVILHFKEIVTFSEYILVFKGCFFCLLIKTLANLYRNLACKAGR